MQINSINQKSSSFGSSAVIKTQDNDFMNKINRITSGIRYDSFKSETGDHCLVMTDGQEKAFLQKRYGSFEQFEKNLKKIASKAEIIEVKNFDKIYSELNIFRSVKQVVKVLTM